jgi:hypothetical protein
MRRQSKRPWTTRKTGGSQPCGRKWERSKPKGGQAASNPLPLAMGSRQHDGKKWLWLLVGFVRGKSSSPVSPHTSWRITVSEGSLASDWIRNNQSSPEPSLRMTRTVCGESSNSTAALPSNSRCWRSDLEFSAQCNDHFEPGRTIVGSRRRR